MTTISAVSSRGTISAARISNAYNILVKQAISNTKANQNVVDSITGRRTSSDVVIGKSVSKSINTGLNVTNVAIAKLESVQQQIKKLKNTVTGLEYVDSLGLKIAAQDYSNQMKEIYNTLKLSNYCGINLFDGTLAQAPAQRVNAQNLPLNAAALNFQTAIDASSHTTVSISQLIAGDARPDSAHSVIGTFNPLFKVTDNAKAALAALDQVPLTTINHNTINAPATSWDGINMNGSFGDQIAKIQAVLPKGINAEQDLINQLAITEFILVARGYTNTIENADRAQKSLKCAQAATRLISLNSMNASDYDKALNNIRVAINSIIGEPGTTAAPGDDSVENGKAKLLNIDAAISYVQAVFKDIVLSTYDLNIQDKKTTAITNFLAMLTAYDSTKTSVANPIYTGSVITSADRKQALEILDNMDNALTSEIANISSSQKALIQSQEIIKIQIPQLDDIANDILSPNYNNIIAEMLQNMRQGKTLSMMRVMEENAYDNRLESLQSFVNS